MTFKVNLRRALTGVAQWVECRFTNRRVARSIPCQGTCLGCGFRPRLGACERQLIDVSLSYRYSSPSLPLSLKINNIFLKQREGEKHHCVKGTSISCLSHAPNQGPGLQPRHVPHPGIKPANPWSTGQRSSSLSHTSRAIVLSF